jgi:hypothetical protein
MGCAKSAVPIRTRVRKPSAASRSCSSTLAVKRSSYTSSPAITTWAVEARARTRIAVGEGAIVFVGS